MPVVYFRPPMRYCPPKLLQALRDAHEGRPVPYELAWQLRSRGWLNPLWDALTPEGAEYLSSHS